MLEQNIHGQKMHVAADDAFREIGFFRNYKQNFKNQPSTCGHQIFNDKNARKIKKNREERFTHFALRLERIRAEGRLGTNQEP